MDFWSLFFIVGAGATIDVLAAPKDKQSSATVMLGAALFFFLLSVLARITGKYNIAGTFAIIYLIASLLDHWGQIPSFTAGLSSTTSTVNGQNVQTGSTATSPVPTQGHPQSAALG